MNMVEPKKELAKERYDRITAYKVGIKLNKRTDSDLIDKIENQENKQGYIKRLILEDIERNKQ